jgi:hypothetical protein
MPISHLQVDVVSERVIESWQLAEESKLEGDFEREDAGLLEEIKFE